MRIPLLGCLTALLLGATALPAAAQDFRTPPTINEREVKTAINEALAAMPQVKCNGQPCAAPTPEEFANPPVQVDEARLAMLTGIKSAYLSWCGLDWQNRTYAMMMRAFLSRYRTEDRGLHVLKMIHAMQLGRDVTNLQVLKTCSPEVRAELSQQNPPLMPEHGQIPIDMMLTDESVTKMIQVVLDRLPEAMCGPKEHCSPATAAEKAKPPVNVEDARTAMTAGVLSAGAQHCGLDWQRRVFGPFMSHSRHKRKMADRQLAILGVLHGTMQGYMLAGFKQRGEVCTDAMRADLEKKIAKP